MCKWVNLFKHAHPLNAAATIKKCYNALETLRGLLAIFGPISKERIRCKALFNWIAMFKRIKKGKIHYKNRELQRINQKTYGLSPSGTCSTHSITKAPLNNNKANIWFEYYYNSNIN